MKNLIVVVGIGNLVAGGLVMGCGDAFTDCLETRTCPPEGQGGAAAGGADGESLAGSGEDDGGRAAGGDTGAPGGVGGDLGEAGSGGAPAECSAGETQCAGNLIQTCEGDQRFGQPEPCPADAPICRLGTCRTGSSCSGLDAVCGGSSDESCCTSPLVEGGPFDRDNDLNKPAEVADFRLDKFEVTVGRFRKFVDAVVGGWAPSEGAGKHQHLKDGKGLEGADASTFEAGWQVSWTAMLPTTRADWSTALNCSASYQTWTPPGGANEELPINCVDWTAAYAFCIWDGGFLPSATEIKYVAAGGKEQRAYPWGSQTPQQNAELAAYGCYFGGGNGTCTGLVNVPTVGTIADGAGKWGQRDLGGSVFEWALDWTGDASVTCDNCAVLAESSAHVKVGGSFASGSKTMLTAGSTGYVVAPKTYELGVRCARIP